MLYRLRGVSRLLTPGASPRNKNERSLIERRLAAARIFLALVSLIAIFLDPTEPSSYATIAYLLMGVYVLWSVIALLLTEHASQWAGTAFVLHVIDLLWTGAITLLTEGPNSPFFLFFVFLMVASAYRWGFRNTLITAAACIGVLCSQAVLLTRGIFATGFIFEGQFDLNRLIMRSAYLLIAGIVLGFLAEADKRHRSEAGTLARLQSKIRLDEGIRASLHPVLQEAAEIFSSRRILIAACDLRTRNKLLWNYDPLQPAVPPQISLLDNNSEVPYFIPVAADSMHAVSGSGAVRAEGIDERGQLVSLDSSAGAEILLRHQASSLMLGKFILGSEWSGYVIILDPSFNGSVETELLFLQSLVSHLSPAVYNVTLLRRLRQHVGAFERARVARELHDGAIQSVLALEMELEGLRAQASRCSPELAFEVIRIQKLMHREALNLRDLMEHIKPLDIAPTELVATLAQIVDKFRRDSGIEAEFLSGERELTLLPYTCRQVARMVQEALTNVRKHSHAQHVVVSLGSADGKFDLVIDDDGGGFDFSGRLSQTELDIGRRGPVVIKERVRLIGGTLAIDSRPGRGSRLEISVPMRQV